MMLLMDAALREALAPVLRDLDGPDGVRPRIREWADVDWPMPGPLPEGVALYAPDGSGMGVQLRDGLDGVEQIAAMADQVQEWAVEALWGLRRPTNWPACPRHPGRHPLEPVADAGRAVWRCPATGDETAEIGHLDD
jgi:hypothetical protein